MLHTAAGFHTGTNLPWIRNGGDFGSNVWHPEGGIASRPVPDDVRHALEHVASAGGSLVRWFVFTDGRSGILFEDNEPVALDHFFLADVACALDLLAEYHLSAVLTLFDFHWCRRARLVNGVQLGGRRRALTDRRLRTHLIERIVVPCSIPLDRTRG